MKLNLPITQREYDYDASFMMVSTTDLKGRITYCNPSFLAVSGFSREELLGKAHNVIRHPDMPPEAFADMWDTIQSGQPWTALVKNRRKDGDHYWVRANATPMMENGEVVGYLSVRVKPTREEVAAAEPLYRRFREGRAEGLRFQRGEIVSTGPAGWIARLGSLGLGARIAASLAAFVAALVLVPLGVQGSLSGTQWAVTAILAAMSLGLGAYLQRAVVRPLKDVTRFAHQIAGGDLRLRARSTRHDDIGVLLRALNQMSINLNAAVIDVRHQIGDMRGVSTEIASGSQDLSARTDRQASSLQQTAASVEQLTAAVRSSAESARQASELAASASAVAQEGGQVVSQVVTTMADITQSSKRIGDIIGVIDGIAFQTNILALNAAVEAARAGEQGRGFAVVASEVRNLAQRSAEAAREIKGLIGASVERVENGARLVEGAGATMADIVQSVRRVTDIINEITGTANEQAAGIEQVNQVVGHLDETTQQNAALVQQSLAAAGQLREQAQVLTDSVGLFRLNEV